MGAFSSCGKQGPLSGCGARASHCSGFSCCTARALERSDFSGCGTWAQYLRSQAWLLRGTWDLPGSGSPALTGGFFTTEPPGKPRALCLKETRYLSSCVHKFAFSYCSRGSQGKNTEWFAIPFSSGPHSVRPLHHDPSRLFWSRKDHIMPFIPLSSRSGNCF